MYIEHKGKDLTGAARIGRVSYSKTGATIYYRGKEFRSLKGGGKKSNYYDVATGEEYWISGPRTDGQDALYRTNIRPEIDEDVREEYWAQIRKLPHPDSSRKHNRTPRRLKLSPLQRDIIVMLEEAGSDTIAAILATVKPSSQSEFLRGVEGLMELGLVRKDLIKDTHGSLTKLILTDEGRVAFKK